MKNKPENLYKNINKITSNLIQKINSDLERKFILSNYHFYQEIYPKLFLKLYLNLYEKIKTRF
jgi:hypothetical protein